MRVFVIAKERVRAEKKRQNMCQWQHSSHVCRHDMRFQFCLVSWGSQMYSCDSDQLNVTGQRERTEMALIGTTSTMAIQGDSSRTVMPQKWSFHVTNASVLQTIIQCPFFP